LSKKC
jgi:hypothetical protein